MRDALTLYTHPMSRGRIARWMIEETGLPYDEVILDFNTSMKSPDYLAINPMGKVPALKHGDVVITENAAICMHLADLVPQKHFAPEAGNALRGSYYRWMLFLAGPLEAYMTAKYSGNLAPGFSAGYGSDGEVLDVLEGVVSQGPHIIGDRFTTVDLYAAATLGYYMRIKALQPRPAFERFVEIHQSRPAFLRANEIDNALVPAHPHPMMAATTSRAEH
ncbi:MAG: glutathione S-transferase family protein [Proteobacteria bacterium]|nr:glutathione S-transferase family protein [Pseudomonadota bacterium]MBS0218421.1 glutathione S-transferase family protein [Pseudomonadota bacterium]